MTIKDINDIIKAVCPNDEDYEKPSISPKYLRQELEQLALEQEQKYLEQGSTTKNDLGVNLIDREMAIEGAWNTELVGIDNIKIVNMLKDLPSVTPQEPRWIPCSEKKPNKGGEYLLWGKIDESEEEEYCFIGDYYEFEEKFGIEISNYDSKTLGFIDTEIEEYYSVVAWMPLPKPYEPQESEK